MRYRIAALMLFTALPLVNVMAAPAPDPSAILDIGPPPKGETAEQYRKRMIEAQTGRITLCLWMSDTELRKLPVIATMKDPRPWLAKNLRVTEEDGQRRLRFTFRAGKRSEQVAILNALLRVNISCQEHGIKSQEYNLHVLEDYIPELEKRIESVQFRDSVDSYRKQIDELRSIRIPKVRAEIARMQQFAVIKRAR